jgi:hypothetical protein
MNTAARNVLDTDLPYDPFTLDNHAQALLERGVMLAPLIVRWQYRIKRIDAFRAWLAMKEIVLAERRMSLDPRIGAVRYLGTYQTVSAAGSTWQTMWGYRTADAMSTMHELCTAPVPSTTIIQMELLDFVRGLKGFLAEAGSEHFQQDVLIPGHSVQA